MLRARYYRPVFCVLFAVSTAIGAVPARVCACSMQPGIRTVAAPEISEPETACCSKRAKSGAKKTEVGAGGIVLPAGACVTCRCETKESQPRDSTPPPAPTNSSSLEFASAPPAPPVLLTVPTTALPRMGEPGSGPPPIDLITILSRLTC